MRAKIPALRDLRSAEGALAGIYGNGALALRASLSSGCRWSFVLVPNAGHQHVYRQYHKVVHGCGHQQKRNQGIEEVAIKKLRSVDLERVSGEIWLAHERGDQRSQQVLHKGSHDCAEGSADHHANGHIDHVATQYEFAKSLEHVPPDSGSLQNAYEYRWERARITS